MDSSWFEDAINEGSKEQQQKLDQWLQDHAAAFEKDWIRNGPGMAPSWTRRDVFFRAIAKMRAASCWHRASGESALMWDTYGNAGVAVQTTVAKLLAFLPMDHRFLISRMRYFPLEEGAFSQAFRHEHHEDRQLMLRPYLMKGLEFEHEQEIRIVTSLDAGLNGIMIKGNDVRNLLDKVVISPRINSAEAAALTEEIQSIINQANVHAGEMSSPEALSAHESCSPLEEEQKRVTVSVVCHSPLSGPFRPDGYEAFAQEIRESIPSREADQVPWPLDTL